MACGCGCDQGGAGAAPPSWTTDYGRGLAPLVQTMAAPAQPGRAVEEERRRPLGGLLVLCLLVYLVWRGLQR